MKTTADYEADQKAERQAHALDESFQRSFLRVILDNEPSTPTRVVFKILKNRTTTENQKPIVWDARFLFVNNELDKKEEQK